MEKKIDELNVDDCDRVAAYELGMLRLYGAVVYGHDLVHILGYTSSEAFRQAVFRKTVPVPTFKRKGFKMRFARTRDIAKWLVAMGKDFGSELTGGDDYDVT